MYLIRINDFTLVDMDTGNVIENVHGGIYITPPNPSPEDGYYNIPVIPGEARERVWKHLESLVQFDVAKADPQPAPARRREPEPAPSLFKVGDKVRTVTGFCGRIDSIKGNVYTVVSSTLGSDDFLAGQYNVAELEPAD